MHVQSARGRQRQQLGGELLRAQPAAGRIGDAAAAGIDAGQPGNPVPPSPRRRCPG
ncbi:hypothetical protein LNP74_18690 [Klebsiella pneumoniae subsp. pneumoniae]|nr:hypothetical protein [Klebsiella pneumoniae subsp. pneumoniae]